MGICDKCGTNAGEHAGYCKACGSDLSGGKKSRVLGQKRPWVKWTVIGAAAAMIVPIAWLAINTGRTGLSIGEQKAMAAQRAPSVGKANYVAVTENGGIVRIPLPAGNDRMAYSYVYSAGRKDIKFFVLRSVDNNVRAAFDACAVCYHAKLGYHQDNDSMICNNCGRGFRSADIGVITGGCNPIPLNKIVDGRMIVLKAKDLAAGARYF